ncbi:MAG: fibronectin type III domain-containing protein [Kiritimatiellia bacterium]
MRDPVLKRWIIANCKPAAPDENLRADGRALICGKHMASWMVGVCSYAIWHNWVLNQREYSGVGDDDYRDQIVGMARQVAKYWWFEEIKGGPYHFNFDVPEPGKVTTQGGGGPYTLSCVDMITRRYLLTGDPRLLEAAKKFWDACNGPDKTEQRLRLQEIAMGSTTFGARQLVYELAHPRKDNRPPEPVTDLKTESLGESRVKLTWTAPKDHGGGKVVTYQVKHAPCPIVPYEDYEYPTDYKQKWTWWAAYNVANKPTPAAPGSVETMVLENLPQGIYYFALCSRDDSMNESQISNVVRVEL